MSTNLGKAESGNNLPARADASGFPPCSDEADGDSRLAPVTLSGWDVVRGYVQMAKNFAIGCVASQVMAGFQLRALHKQFAIKPGRPAVNSASNAELNHGGKTWAEIVEAEAGIAERTGRNWMEMAEAVKPRLKKLLDQEGLGQLLLSPPQEWTNDEAARVVGLLKAASDGMTQIEFMRELGIVKKLAGNVNAAGKGKAALSVEGQLELMLQDVAEKREVVRNSLMTMGVKFTLVPDEEVEADCDILRRHLAAREAWLRMPKSKRDTTAIEKMLR